jgi:hypothetical protein
MTSFVHAFMMSGSAGGTTICSAQYRGSASMDVAAQHTTASRLSSAHNVMHMHGQRRCCPRQRWGIAHNNQRVPLMCGRNATAGDKQATHATATTTRRDAR